MLIFNELNHKCSLNEKIRELKEIRNSELVSDTFKNISPFVIKTKVKYLILLLKLRQYFLLSLIFK